LIVLYSIKAFNAGIIVDKNKYYFQFDPAWLSDLALLVDISKHINLLNIKLQGRVHLTNKLFEHVCVFELKLRLWVGQLKRCNYAHFPTLSTSQPNEATTYVAFVGQLREQLKNLLADLHPITH